MCKHCKDGSPIICVGQFSAIIKENRLVIDYHSNNSPQRVVRVIDFCPICGHRLGITSCNSSDLDEALLYIDDKLYEDELCGSCITEHEQIRSWLIELRNLREGRS